MVVYTAFLEAATNLIDVAKQINIHQGDVVPDPLDKRDDDDAGKEMEDEDEDDEDDDDEVSDVEEEVSEEEVSDDEEEVAATQSAAISALGPMDEDGQARFLPSGAPGRVSSGAAAEIPIVMRNMDGTERKKNKNGEYRKTPRTNK